LKRTDPGEALERGDGLRAERDLGGRTPPGAFRIALVIVAGLVALPAFAIGAQLDAALGVKGVIEASLGGGAILACVAVLAAIAGARSGLSTYALIINAFGTQGGKVVNFVLAAVLLGWFGVVLMMFASAASQGLESLGVRSPTLLWALAGAAVMTATALIGFRAMEAVARVSTPLKFILLFWAAFAALGAHTGLSLWHAPVVPKISLVSATSLVAGGVIVGALLTPDICRFARSATHAAVGCGIAFGLGLPLILSVAAIPAQMTGRQDIVQIMVSLGLGVPALLIVAFAGWSTNAQNLYSTSLIFATLAPKQTHARLAIAAGVLGAFVGLSGISQNLLPFLSLLSIGIPPVAGVFLTHFYFDQIRGRPAGASAWGVTAFTSWALGSGVAGLEAWWRFTLSSITAIDTLLVSAVAYGVIRFATEHLNIPAAPASKRIT